MLEAHIPDIKYNKEPENNASDALGRLQLTNSDVIESNITREHLAEIYCVNKIR